MADVTTGGMSRLSSAPNTVATSLPIPASLSLKRAALCANCGTPYMPS